MPVVRRGSLFVIIVQFIALHLCAGNVVADNGDDRFDYYFYEAVNQGNQRHYAEAFDLLLYCNELNPSSAAVKYELAQYYVMLGDKERPGMLLREAVELEPDNYWYWQMLGGYYARVHQYAEAIVIFEKMAAHFPTRIDILSALMSLYEEAGEYRKGLSVLDRIELLEGESMEWTVQRFQLYVEMKDIDSAYIIIKPNVEWFIETFSDMVSNYSELTTIRSLCRLAVKDAPENLSLHYWNAVSEMRGGEVEAALQALENGISNIKENPDSVDAARLYTLRGDIYYTLKKMPEVYDSYEKALLFNPDDNMTANNLAYFLSLDKRELARAEAMSFRTIEEEPLNATYLDTYAWILFAQGRYKEALEYIGKAVQCQGEPSADVMEHCGDINYMNGNIDEALHYWHEAVELHSESKTIEQKILQKKFIEDER